MEKETQGAAVGQVTLREATADDAQALLDIYAPYVLHTAITFEYDVPTLDEFRRRITSRLGHYPYLVATDVATGQIVGYAYASKFHERAAFQFTAESSIYLRTDAHGRGIGTTLLGELERRLIAQGIKSICASIAYTQVADPHLDNTSMLFHERMGYRLVAHFHRSGYKFNHWYDTIWMEKLV